MSADGGSPNNPQQAGAPPATASACCPAGEGAQQSPPLPGHGRRAGPPAAGRRLVVADQRPLRLDRQRLCPAGPGDDQRRRVRADHRGRRQGEPARRRRRPALPHRPGALPHRPCRRRGGAGDRAYPGRADARRLPAGRRRRTTRRSEDADYKRKAFERQQGLLAKGVSSQASFDTAQNDLRAAEQALTQAEQNVAAARAALGGDPTIATDRHPAVLAALARRDQAALDLEEHRSARAGRRRRRPGRPHAGRPVRLPGDRRDEPGRDRRELGRGELQGDRTDQDASRPEGDGFDRRLSRPHVRRPRSPASAPAPARSSRCCRRRTPPATGSRSCSACRCASASPTPIQTRRCAPASAPTFRSTPRATPTKTAAN